jgi:hypothetical protein
MFQPRTVQRELVVVPGSFAPNGSSAIVAANNVGKGWSVARSGVGTYTVTFEDAYPALQSFACSLQKATPDGGVLQASTYSSSNKTMVMKHLTTDDTDAVTQTISWQKDADDVVGEQRTISYALDADEAAGLTGANALTEVDIGTLQLAGTVKAVKFTPSAALTAHDTNYATLIVARYDASGGSKTTVATITTETGGSGDWTAFDAMPITLAGGAASTLTADFSLSFEITKAAGGVAIPSGTLTVEYDANVTAAGVATAETAIGRAQVASTVSAVHYVPTDALTAHDTNYATLTLYQRAAGGGSQTKVAEALTTTGDTGNWTAFAPVALTLEASPADSLDAGQPLTVAIAKAAAGVVVPDGTLVVTFANTAVAAAAADIAANANNRVNFVAVFRNTSLTR